MNQDKKIKTFGVLKVFIYVCRNIYRTLKY